jgi:hypothetical protein
MKTPLCKSCNKEGHYKSFCTYTKRKGINPRGKEHDRWKEFRDNTAIPYLDKNFGHTCRCCGVGGKLDVDHIHGKGSRPELKYQLSNLQYLCRHPCHFNKTNHIVCNHY